MVDFLVGEFGSFGGSFGGIMVSRNILEHSGLVQLGAAKPRKFPYASCLPTISISSRKRVSSRNKLAGLASGSCNVF